MDVALTTRTREGRLTFEEFYRLEFLPVFRAVFLMVGDRELAQDLTQEAFERAFAKWKRLERQEWVGGWVMTTALNLCRRTWRNRRPEKLDALPIDPRTGHASDERIDLERALLTLPSRQRQTLILYYIGDMSVHMVAQSMNVSEGTVKAHLAQGRAALAKILGEVNERSL